MLFTQSPSLLKWCCCDHGGLPACCLWVQPSLLLQASQLKQAIAGLKQDVEAGLAENQKLADAKKQREAELKVCLLCVQWDTSRGCGVGVGVVSTASWAAAQAGTVRYNLRWGCEVRGWGV